jgi:hypothetical protein
MESRSKIIRLSDQGIALVIVLAFVVLVAGLVLAFLSRSATHRQVAHGSFNDAKADQLARAALEIATGDLKQEIVNGSNVSTVGGAKLYSPSTNANIWPVRSGNPTSSPDPIPNLVRRSLRSDPIAAPGITSRGSAINSATDLSLNGRSISLARWNKHYFIPKANTGDGKSDPVSSFVAPDWVLITSSGPKAFSTWDSSLRDVTAPNFVSGRYAYAIYDEGGLIDVNVAGYPSNMELIQAGRKGSLAFADLKTLGIPNDPGDDPKQIDRLVGWRNYASSQPTVDNSGSFPKFSFTTSSVDLYYNFVSLNTLGFLKTSSAVWNARTDQAFVTRQHLLEYSSSSGLGVNTLQYLTHFSREAQANTPQWTPANPDSVNPNFQTLRVTATFARNDGSTAKVDEPLVKKRFLLQRLNWLTYKGPSASRTIPASAPASSSDPDYDMWLLTNRFGLTPSFLQQGTVTNIANYFGLQWDTANERWGYVGHGAGSSLANSIQAVSALTGSREPDFFELLQAGILNSSLGDASSPDAALPVVHQQSKTLHLLTIGANLIAQARTDSYPVRIAFSNGGTIMEAIGSSRLPFLSSIAACPVAGTKTTGGINWFVVPNLWDPFRDTWDLTETNIASTLTPAYPRPTVRITVNGSVDFGATVSAPQSGSIPSSSVTSFSSPLTGINSSLVLKTGSTTGNAYGRDGLGEASRLGTSDFTAALTSYTTTTSPTTSGFAWNSITRPARPDGTVPGSTNFVVFRLSLPGSAIPTTAIGQNAVLILKPALQFTMDYQSPNGQWYSYSFLQGNNATSTWISSNLNLVTSFSQYGLNPAPTPAPPATSPTVLSSGSATAWDMTTLAQAPMFAKADPRSIRYNSQIGVVNLASPPLIAASAGIIGSIWPDKYSSSPLMTTTSSPGPTPSPNPNPATYSQTIGDNGAASSNPFNESGTKGDAVRPVMMNRPFRSVGEMGYAFRDQPFKTVDFSSSGSPDAALLDLFSVNEYDDPSDMRAGVVNLNTRQSDILAAVLTNAIRREDTARVTAGSPPSSSPSPSPVTETPAKAIGTSLVSLTNSAPVMNKAELVRLIAAETGLGPSVQKTQREAIARALGEVDQTRTWNLMIDVIAQSGRYPPNAAKLPDFVVEGEKRYWLHVAIDRFTGELIDQQLEAVYE